MVTIAWATTVIGVSTTPTPVISTLTTWAHTRNGSLYDPVPLVIVNIGALSVYVGSSAVSSANPGIPLGSSANMSFSLLPSDPLFAVTTNSTGSLSVMAGRQ